MRAVLLAAVMAFIVAPLQTSAPAAPINIYAHVRPLQKDAEVVIADGMARSATFRRLVNTIEQSDVIVYVDIRPDMRESIGGSLRFLAKSATHRFLRVQLNRADSPMWRVALLGHELQHAVEVVGAPDVASVEDLRALYRRIGMPTGANSYDSVQAQQAGYTVRNELAASRASSGWRFARGASESEPVAAGESLGVDGADLESESRQLSPAEGAGRR